MNNKYLNPYVFCTTTYHVKKISYLFWVSTIRFLSKVNINNQMVRSSILL